MTISISIWMTRILRIAALLGALICVSSPALSKGEAAAADSAWRIGKVRGEAWIEAPNREKMRLRRDRVLFPGQTLITADRTRLQLVHGKQRIQVGSNTVLSLPPLEETEAGRTKIYQLRGTTHLVVDKRGIKHFSVETPYMVAAVKGTQFSVTLENGHADLRVHEGLVEVTSKLSEEVVDVAAGQAISMDVSALASLEMSRSEVPPAKMAFFDRGQDIPSSSPAAPDTPPEATAPPSQGLLSMIGGLVSTITLYVSGLISASVQSVTGSISGFFWPVVNKLQADGTLKFFIAGSVALAGLIAGLGFLLYRRKKYRVDLSRTGF